MLDAYGRTWPGWSIRWAHDGIADVVAYLGEDRRVVRGASPDESELYPDGRNSPGSPIRRLLTASDETACHTYGLTDRAAQPWRLGPDLLSRLADEAALSTPQTMPTSGFHLDTTRRRAGVWSIEALAGLAEWWPDRWPGWELTLRDDDYRRQLANCRRAITLRTVDLPKHVAELAERVNQYWPVKGFVQARGGRQYLAATLLNAMVGNDRLVANVSPREITAAVAIILDGSQGQHQALGAR